MSTKTMRLPPRRILTPDKRPAARPLAPAKLGADRAEPVLSNQLLAGYLAHEFLTKGTLFGEPWDPARAQADQVSSASSSEQKKSKPSHEPEPSERENFKRRKFYEEVAHLVRADGTQVPGIINPAQLARYLKL